jgi:large subunit ribosomal protein L35
MPKLKTHSGTKDRFKVTKNGKVMHGHAFKSHNLSKKGAARKRNFAVPQTATGKAAKSIKRKLGV